MSQSYNFVYLDVGKSPLIKIELYYSISTLLAEIPCGNRIVLYTDKPDEYRCFPVDIVDINEIISSAGNPYVYRFKPCVLLHELKKSGAPCVFMDSDTYILPGFFDALQSRMQQGALLDDVETTSRLFSEFSYSHSLPHKDKHSPNPGQRIQGNSGVIGVQPGWGESVLEDALAIIDQVLEAGKWPRTLEQSAILEAIWLHQIPVQAIHPWIVHYCTQSKKRYMRFQIKRLLRRQSGNFIVNKPSIKFNKVRVKLYQYFYDVHKTSYKIIELLKKRVKFS